MMPGFDETDDQQAAFFVRMSQLIAKEKLGELSDAEREELRQSLAGDERYAAWKAELDQPALIAVVMDELSIAEAHVESSLESFHRLHTAGRPVRRVPGRQISRWWAAAAVLVPIVAIGIWVAERHSGPAVTTGQVTSAIPPGGSRATLTLGNGSRILLDTNATGHLVQKGGIQVQYDQGKIDYATAKIADSEVTYNTLATAKGGQYQLTLPDGSKVWLNAASSLRYPTAFIGKERHVELTGEAYFEVAQQKDQPFTVGVGTMNVKVLGTEFDVMAYPEEGHKLTTLIQGSVKVQSGGEAKQLAVGQQSVVAAGSPMNIVTDIDVENVVAWKTGFFRFKDIDLQTMMREIARWYDIDVQFERQDLTLKFGGRISRKLNLSELISLLEGNGVGHFKLEGRKLIVLP